MHQFLAIAEHWGKINGVEFAPSKSAIVAEDKTEDFKMYGVSIEFVDLFKYLGIMFRHTGIHWNKSFEQRITKALKLIKWMQSKGMYLYGWRPYSSVVIYKCFIRPTLEYGLALQILPNTVTKELQRVQNTALRAIFSVGNSTSIAALHSITGIVPMSHRNIELNGKYSFRIITHEPGNFLLGDIYSSIKDASPNEQHGTLYKVNSENSLLPSILEPTSSSLNTARKNAIENMNAGKRPNNVASAVPIQKDLSTHPVLKAKFLTRQEAATLIYWILGKVACHQECRRCGASTSRAHAIECTDATNKLRTIFSPDLFTQIRTNSIDVCLHSLKFKEEERSKIDKLLDVINEIKRRCLGWRINRNGDLVRPNDPSLEEEYDVP